MCLKSDIAPLNINRSSDSVSVDFDAMNLFIQNENILNIEPWIPGATDMDRDGDIYLNRIYRLTISEGRSDNIPVLINKLNRKSFVKYAEQNT